MTQYTDTKLKKLLQTWPQGTVCLASELNHRGIGYDLQGSYRKSGWISSIGQGAVIRNGDTVSWHGGIYALQAQGKLKIHVGAKTALAMQGFAHFINLAKGKIQIFGPPGTRLPKWFVDFRWDGKIEYHRSSLFSENADLGLQTQNFKTFDIKVSSPERAFLEMLDLVPQTETFNEVSLISEGLSTLRPKMIQPLLENCTSIKVKRLFLYLIEKQGHAWIKRLDMSKIDLGKGDRQIVKGGIIDKKYRITIPKDHT